jgi:hypothetical protein
MTDYTIQVGWSGKDALSDSDPAKVISGGDFNTEFTAVTTAVNSKMDKAANLSDVVTPATARTNIGAAALGANTFTNTQSFADNIASRPLLQDYGEIVNAIGSTGGGTQDIDLTLGNVVSATVDTSTNTFTFSNPTATGKNCGFILYLTNGGSQTVAWPASVDFPAATAPTLTEAGVDILVFNTTDAGTRWYGNLVGAAYA